MKKVALVLVFLMTLFSCKQDKVKNENIVLWQPYNDSLEVAANKDHEVKRMQYKLIQSKVLDKKLTILNGSPLY